MDFIQRPLKRLRRYEDNVDVGWAREESKARLKSTLEDVIDKYSRDFTDIGDEIDMETGDIVVDNGHLSGMRHEVDPGLTRTTRDARNSMLSTTSQEGGSEDELTSLSEVSSNNMGRLMSTKYLVD